MARSPGSESRTTAVGRKRKAAEDPIVVDDQDVQEKRQKFDDNDDYVAFDDFGDSRRDSKESGEISTSAASSRRISGDSSDHYDGNRPGSSDSAMSLPMHPRQEVPVVNPRVTPMSDDEYAQGPPVTVDPGELRLCDVDSKAFKKFILQQVRETKLTVDTIVRQCCEPYKPFHKQAIRAIGKLTKGPSGPGMILDDISTDRYPHLKPKVQQMLAQDRNLSVEDALDLLIRHGPFQKQAKQCLMHCGGLGAARRPNAGSSDQHQASPPLPDTLASHEVIGTRKRSNSSAQAPPQPEMTIDDIPKDYARLARAVSEIVASGKKDTVSEALKYLIKERKFVEQARICIEDFEDSQAEDAETQSSASHAAGSNEEQQSDAFPLRRLELLYANPSNFSRVMTRGDLHGIAPLAKHVKGVRRDTAGKTSIEEILFDTIKYHGDHAVSAKRLLIEFANASAVAGTNHARPELADDTEPVPDDHVGSVSMSREELVAAVRFMALEQMFDEPTNFMRRMTLMDVSGKPLNKFVHNAMTGSTRNKSLESVLFAAARTRKNSSRAAQDLIDFAKGNVVPPAAARLYAITDGQPLPFVNSLLLYVANLGPETIDLELQDFFGKFRVARVYIPPVQSRRWNTTGGTVAGFVQMADAREAKQAVSELDGKEFGGHRVSVAYFGTPSNESQTIAPAGNSHAATGKRTESSQSGQAGDEGDETDPLRARLYVGSLKPGTKALELKEFFDGYMGVTLCNPTYKHSKGSKAWIVQFESAAEAHRAMQDRNGKNLKGNTVTIKPAPESTRNAKPMPSMGIRTSMPKSLDGGQAEEDRPAQDREQYGACPEASKREADAENAHQDMDDESDGGISVGEPPNNTKYSHDYGQIARAAAAPAAYANASHPLVRLQDISTRDQDLQYRYFHLTNPDSYVRCLCCGGEGHMEDDCPEHQCKHCRAIDDHFSAACPIWRKCSLCRERGHSSNSCTRRGVDAGGPGDPCDICGGSGHDEASCAGLWKTYAVDPRDAMKVERMRVFCYNCGDDDHWGDDCAMMLPEVLSKSSNHVWSKKYAEQFLESGYDSYEGEEVEMDVAEAGRRTWQVGMLDDRRD